MCFFIKSHGTLTQLAKSIKININTQLFLQKKQKISRH